MELREPGADDTDRIRKLVDSSMTTTFQLSPQQIDAVATEVFSDERLTEAIESEETVLRVAETDDEIDETAVVGFAEGQVHDDRGELRWLFVDPEHRGKGIGTELFETTAETLRDRDVDRVRATTLEANAEGGQFVQRFGFERVDERTIELAEESLVEHVHAEQSAETESEEMSSASKSDDTDDELPNTIGRDGETVATTDDDQAIFVERDDFISGTEASLYVAYSDRDHSEQFGFYCANCGSVDTAMDTMDQIECGNCGNTHSPKSSDSYDGSYL